MSVKYFCDKCGKEGKTTSPAPKVSNVVTSYRNLYTTDPGGDVASLLIKYDRRPSRDGRLDLCKPCFAGLEQAVLSWWDVSIDPDDKPFVETQR